MNVWAKVISRILIALMIWAPYQIATAAMIGTDQVVASSSQADRTTVLNFLSRSDVANKLQSLGLLVPPAGENVIRVFPALIADKAALDEGIDILSKAAESFEATAKAAE